MGKTSLVLDMVDVQEHSSGWRWNKFLYENLCNISSTWRAWKCTTLLQGTSLTHRHKMCYFEILSLNQAEHNHLADAKSSELAGYTTGLSSMGYSENVDKTTACLYTWLLIWTNHLLLPDQPCGCHDHQWALSSITKGNYQLWTSIQ